jgi:hypothetical protein
LGRDQTDMKRCGVGRTPTVTQTVVIDTFANASLP